MTGKTDDGPMRAPRKQTVSGVTPVTPLVRVVHTALEGITTVTCHDGAGFVTLLNSTLKEGVTGAGTTQSAYRVTRDSVKRFLLDRAIVPSRLAGGGER